MTAHTIVTRPQWSSIGDKVFDPLGQYHATFHNKVARAVVDKFNIDLDAGVSQAWQQN